MKANSSVENPAMLCASNLTMYCVAGVRPVMAVRRCGFRALDTRVHWDSDALRYCRMKYNIGQPLSGHTCNLRITDVEFGEMKLCDDGTPGGWP